MDILNVRTRDKVVHYFDRSKPYQTRCGLWILLFGTKAKRRRGVRYGKPADPTPDRVSCVECLGEGPA